MSDETTSFLAIVCAVGVFIFSFFFWHPQPITTSTKTGQVSNIAPATFAQRFDGIRANGSRS